MQFLIGKPYRLTLDNDTYLDVSIYPKKWTTDVSMSLWKNGNGIALESIDKTYLNLERFLPKETAEKITKYFVNKHSQKVAGLNFFSEID